MKEKDKLEKCLDSYKQALSILNNLEYIECSD